MLSGFDRKKQLFGFIILGFILEIIDVAASYGGYDETTSPTSLKTLFILSGILLVFLTLIAFRLNWARRLFLLFVALVAIPTFPVNGYRAVSFLFKIPEPSSWLYFVDIMSEYAFTFCFAGFLFFPDVRSLFTQKPTNKIVRYVVLGISVVYTLFLTYGAFASGRISG